MSKTEIPLNEAELAALMDELEAELSSSAAVVEKAPNAETREAMQEAQAIRAAVDSVATAASAPWAEPDPVETLVPAPVAASPAPKPSRAYRGHVIASPTGLQHFIDVPQFQEDIHVDEVNMDEAMMTQAGMRAFYGAQAAYAEGQASREKAKFEIFEAKLNEIHRKDLVAKGDKVTEAMVLSAVKADARWIAAKERVIEAETIASINKSLVVAMGDRKDMLVQLGSDRRKDYEGQLRIVAHDSSKNMTADRARDIAAGIAARHG